VPLQKNNKLIPNAIEYSFFYLRDKTYKFAYYKIDILQDNSQ